MQHLFPVSRYKGLRQRLLRPLANETAIVLDLKGWPLPRWMLNLFLSPFFFPDKSARLALLVPKWMDFSMDMDNFRSNWIDSQHWAGQFTSIRPAGKHFKIQKMNIYFACSITGGRDFEPVYQAIVAALLADGHTVLPRTWPPFSFAQLISL